MVCPVCPSGVAVPCCLIGEYAKPIIFGDTVVIGMPQARPLTDKNRPLNKVTLAEKMRVRMFYYVRNLWQYSMPTEVVLVASRDTSF